MSSIQRLSATPKGRAALGALGAAVLVVVASVITVVTRQQSPHVLGASATKAVPPQPSITGGPAAVVTSTSATFTFTDKQAGVTFLCSFGNAAFVGCTSPKSYSSLAEGSHTFRVEAVAAGATSTAATAIWTIDSSAPNVGLTFPAAGGVYNAASWSNGCKSSVCGVATDATGVQAVAVAIGRSTGGYWDGKGFGSSNPIFTTAKGTATWSIGLPLPADGDYTVLVRATDTLGTTTTSTGQAAPNLAGFSIDTVGPVAPTITAKPDNPTASTSATFSYSGGEDVGSFQCKLDKASFSACGSGTTGSAAYSGLSVADHNFQVVAIDAAGNISLPASFAWTIATSAGFTISSQPLQPFYPGTTQSVNLVFSNPNNFAISISNVTAAVNAATSNSGCVGNQNLVISQPFSGSVVVPANGTLTMSDTAFGAQRPQVTMADLSSSQDVCKGATFSLSYAGIAVKA